MSGDRCNGNIHHQHNGMNGSNGTGTNSAISNSLSSWGGDTPSSNGKVMIQDDGAWTKSETSLLLDLVSKEEDWQIIAQNLGTKSPQQCCDWYDYLEQIAKHFPKRHKLKNPGQQRKRRKAAQIERLYKCQEKFCNRSYGTEGALKMHIKLKHPSVTYNETYQQQARRAAAILNQKLLEDKYEEDEDDGSYEEPLRTNRILDNGYDNRALYAQGKVNGDGIHTAPGHKIGDVQYIHRPQPVMHHAVHHACVPSHPMQGHTALSLQGPLPNLQNNNSPTMGGTKSVLKRSLMDICQMSALSGAKRFKASSEETGIVNTLCELEHGVPNTVTQERISNGKNNSTQKPSQHMRINFLSN